MKESRYNVWVEREGAHYVFNGMSGALLRVPGEEHAGLRQFLDGNPAPACRPSLLVELTRGRMLIPDDSDELDLLSMRYKASREDSSHMSLTLVTSLGCNFDCPYCFEAKHPSIMDAEVELALLQLVEDRLPSIGSFNVTWFGGEPLVGKKPLLALSDAFIERCDRAEVPYSADIITNGYLLDEPTCEQLRERRVVWAQVCLDGSPETHDRMRPLASGKGTFWRIIRNLHHAVNYMQIGIRMNVDHGNFGYAEELLRILRDEGFVGKLSVGLGHIVPVSSGVPSPSSTYRGACFSNRDFAFAELQFEELAARYGFGGARLPRPTGAPCTAVRKHDLVVGSKGELYKCWDSVGNGGEAIGNIRSYRDINSRINKWLQYDPVDNSECRSCIALPVCMGGCARHALDVMQYDNRCGTFRHTFQEQVLTFVEAAERAGAEGLVDTAEPRELLQVA